MKAVETISVLYDTYGSGLDWFTCIHSNIWMVPSFPGSYGGPGVTMWSKW